LQSIKDLRYKGGVAKTNFEPVIDHDNCDLCETCADMCPIEVMSPGEDETGEIMTIDRDFCIGCGVCAVNCPQEAIRLEKTTTNIPVQSRPGLFGESAQ
jgi:Pyruvate/2-oxoacid:ferredoxin oxidoreductase delta subunit